MKFCSSNLKVFVEEARFLHHPKLFSLFVFSNEGELFGEGWTIIIVWGLQVSHLDLCKNEMLGLNKKAKRLAKAFSWIWTISYLPFQHHSHHPPLQWRGMRVTYPNMNRKWNCEGENTQIFSSEIILAWENVSQGHPNGKFLISKFLKGLTHSALILIVIALLEGYQLAATASHGQ